MTNATDEKQIKSRRDRQKRDRVTRETILRVLMSDREGRRFVWLDLAKSNVFSQNEHLLDSHPRLAFNEGRRSLGLELLVDVSALCPEQYIQMIREASGLDKEEENDGYSDSE